MIRHHSSSGSLPKVKKLVVMSDRSVPQTGTLSFDGEYEGLLATSSPDYLFPDFDENTQATTFYTSGITGVPKGVYYSHWQVVLHCLSELAFLGLAGKLSLLLRKEMRVKNPAALWDMEDSLDPLSNRT
jgi:fatty-acyl-CoA synthase